MRSLVRIASKAITVFATALVVSACGNNPNGGPRLDYKVVRVTDGGAITGSVRFLGEVPPAVPVLAARDSEVCGRSHPNPSAPGSGPGIQGAVVYIERISEGKDWAGIATAPLLDQRKCEYAPHIQLAKVGSQVSIRNSDPITHDYHFFIKGESFLSDPQPAGASPRMFTLERPGLNVITCDIHTWMRGYIFVADHPYVTLTDSLGNYSLTNVPPGKYVLKVWRDSWVLRQPVDAYGKVLGYDWDGEYRNQSEIEVQPNTSVSHDFMLH